MGGHCQMSTHFFQINIEGGERVMSYWQDRLAGSQAKLSEKKKKQIEKQLTKYYQQASQKCINEFEKTYFKVVKTVGDGKQPTPADLYKLDSYWQMLGQVRGELEKLGDKQIKLLTKEFKSFFMDAYNSYAIPGEKAFSTIDTEVVEQMINQIWCADGKSFSQRIWGNTERLIETLNEELINVLVVGKKTTDLKKILQQRFGVSYSRANAIARTEIAHIQTQAAVQRYKDYGITHVQVWADKDERQCEVCGKLHKKIYPAGAVVPIPAHTNCRCCIIPVVD